MKVWNGRLEGALIMSKIGGERIGKFQMVHPARVELAWIISRSVIQKGRLSVLGTKSIIGGFLGVFPHLSFAMTQSSASTLAPLLSLWEDILG